VGRRVQISGSRHTFPAPESRHINFQIAGLTPGDFFVFLRFFLAKQAVGEGAACWTGHGRFAKRRPPHGFPRGCGRI